MDKKKLFQLSHNLGLNHYKNVDLIYSTEQITTIDFSNKKSIVNTSLINESFNISFSKGKLRLATSGTLILRKSLTHTPILTPCRWRDNAVPLT